MSSSPRLPRSERLTRLASCVVLANLVLARPAGAGDASDEAERQIRFARSELAAGQPDRALVSAASALRLDPLRYEAILLKGLAYEQIGDTERARALVVSYLEIAGPRLAGSEATEAIERLDGRARSPGSETGEARPANSSLSSPVVRTRVENQGDGTVVVHFGVAAGGPAPLLHWRKSGGEWKSARMVREGAGRWELRLRLSDVRDGKLAWYVEVAGSPITDEQDGERRPFRLALN